eukprot:239393-Pelagomonas_calceolata.AAC.3
MGCQVEAQVMGDAPPITGSFALAGGLQSRCMSVAARPATLGLWPGPGSLCLMHHLLPPKLIWLLFLLISFLAGGKGAGARAVVKGGHEDPWRCQGPLRQQPLRKPLRSIDEEDEEEQ